MCICRNNVISSEESRKWLKSGLTLAGLEGLLFEGLEMIENKIQDT